MPSHRVGQDRLNLVRDLVIFHIARDECGCRPATDFAHRHAVGALADEELTDLHSAPPGFTTFRAP